MVPWLTALRTENTKWQIPRRRERERERENIGEKTKERTKLAFCLISFGGRKRETKIWRKEWSCANSRYSLFCNKSSLQKRVSFRPFVRPFVRPSVRPFVHSSFRPFVRPCIRSFFCSVRNVPVINHTKPWSQSLVRMLYLHKVVEEIKNEFVWLWKPLNDVRCDGALSFRLDCYRKIADSIQREVHIWLFRRCFPRLLRKQMVSGEDPF